MERLEKDLGRHTVLNILTEAQVTVSDELKPQVQEILDTVKAENEEILKVIMKVCFASKNGAEYILDDLIDELSKENDDEYFLEKAGLTDFLDKFDLDDADDADE